MIIKRDLMNADAVLMLWSIKDTSSKRKAAERLGTSVDTISKYIDTLEDNLGMKLVANGGRGCVLTLNGEKVLSCSSGIIEGLKNLNSLQPESRKASGEVRVGMMAGIGSNFNAYDVSDFFDKYPDLKLVAVNLDQMSDLDILSYDIALTHENPSNPELESVFSREIDCGFFASSAYLQRYGYPLDEMDMLHNHRFVCKINHVGYNQWWREFSKKAKLMCYSSNTPYALLHVIRNGLGIGVMPLQFKNDGLVCLDNITCPIKIKFHLIAHKGTKNRQRIRVCLDYYTKLLNRI